MQVARLFAVLMMLGFVGTLVGCPGPETNSEPPVGTAPGDPNQPDGDTGIEPVTTTGNPHLLEGAQPADPDAPEEFSETESGLKYRILRASDGPKPVASDTVTVHYRGWLDNGNEFDSSYGRGEPISFPLGGVIPGWTEGMQLVGEGGMIELWIPSELGYGEGGSGGSIPANADLHFVVELLEIQDASAEQ